MAAIVNTRRYLLKSGLFLIKNDIKENFVKFHKLLIFSFVIYKKKAANKRIVIIFNGRSYTLKLFYITILDQFTRGIFAKRSKFLEKHYDSQQVGIPFSSISLRFPLVENMFSLEKTYASQFWIPNKFIIETIV